MNDLTMDAFDEFHRQWALVTAGSLEDHNSMTVSWGGIGSLWGKPVATVYIRPNRHTYGYFEANEYFTVSFYPEEYKNALGVMGKLSGRDCDKDAEAGLTAIPCGETVTYKEARRTLLCRLRACPQALHRRDPRDLLNDKPCTVQETVQGFCVLGTEQQLEKLGFVSVS